MYKERKTYCTLLAIFSAGASALVTTSVFGYAQQHIYLWALVSALTLWAGVSMTIIRFGEEDNEPVDPWRLQKKLMTISDQSTPITPCLTKDSMLYMALMLEEVGETASAMQNALHAELVRSESETLYQVSALCTLAARDCATTAGHIRRVLGKMKGQRVIHVNDAAMTELLDGITDVHVVTAGLGIASGLPGAAAYRVVVESNLSKANPETGIIDKDPSGKWKKGKNYHAPDLAVLIENAYF